MAKRLCLPVVFWLVLLHVGALTAPWFFTWGAFACFVVLSVVTGMAVTLGYHRLLTHGSFKTTPRVRWVITLLATLAGQGGCLQWVADHRRHHQFADKPGDPHSPREGFWWAHAIWNCFNNEGDVFYLLRYVPDLWEDRGLVWLHRHHVHLHFVLAAVLYLIGGWPWVVWGMFARLVYVLHSTWLVNSAAHLWGYCNAKTADNSRNNAFVALLTFGEGWHSNHHCLPRVANHGWQWWEFDPTYRVIRLMERFGLAWNVVEATEIDGRWRARMG